MVEIIPKRIEQASGWQRFLLPFGILVLLLAGGASAALPYAKSQNEREIFKINEQLRQLTSGEHKALEQEIVRVKNQVEGFVALSRQRKDPLGAFRVVEQTTLPEVFFKNASLRLADRTFDLSGAASSFLALEQQMRVYEQTGEIREAQLISLSLGEEGEVLFSVKLVFDPSVP